MEAVPPHLFSVTQPRFILIHLVTLTHMLHVPLCLQMAWVQA